MVVNMCGTGNLRNWVSAFKYHTANLDVLVDTEKLDVPNNNLNNVYLPTYC